MTTGNESDPRDVALARAWRAQSADSPPAALDAAILAAAHRAVGSGPRDAAAQSAEATRPQRWWMPLAAAATIGVVVIGILQVAPQAPVDLFIGERADVAGRVTPAASPAAPVAKVAAAPDASVAASSPAAPVASSPAPMSLPAARVSSAADAAKSAVAPALSSAAVAGDESRKEDSRGTVAPPSPAPAAPPRASSEVRQQTAPAAAMPSPAPEPFPADKLSKKTEADTAPRLVERKDAAESARTSARSNGTVASGALMALPPAPAAASAPTVAAAPPPTAAPMLAAAQAPEAGAAPTSAGAAKTAARMRENGAARDEASAPNAPATASPDQASSSANPVELQTRARDPDAWIARIRKLRADGRVAEAASEMREFRRYVPNAEARLPQDLREWYPRP